MLLLKKATKEDIHKLTDISKEAFDTDVTVGNSEVGGPPGYDSYEWHRKMMEEDHLYSFWAEEKIAGGAVLFKEAGKLYVGRIFVCPEIFRRGYGRKLMKAIEELYLEVQTICLDTPVWNVRTNHFYKKCGYTETGRDEEAVYYCKKRW